jgi:hypothetical protein
VEPGGGITPVLVSAIKAAKMITRHFSLDPAACSAVPGD